MTEKTKQALKRFAFETLAILAAIIAVKAARSSFEYSITLSAFMFILAMNLNNFARGNK